MTYKKLIDNERITLADTLREIAPNYQHLSIATGYWDLPGTLELLDCIYDYKNIRLLIGQEPLSHRLQTSLKIDPNDSNKIFPDADFMHDLVETGKMRNAEVEQIEQIRNTASRLTELLNTGNLEVKVFRKPRLHAKAYIFGTLTTPDAVGIVGSSNFTKAGLRTNRELNSLEDNSKIVQFDPKSPQQEHGHLSWFETYWNDPEAVDWTGDFSNLIGTSPVGNVAFGAYDVYIKTLMEVFPDELTPPQELSQDTEDVLYSFQNRNAGILLNKLNKMGVAMLSDSVGLGKTITAGAVIKHYLLTNKHRIVVIAPAALKAQWKDDLGERFRLVEGHDFKVVSMQDMGALDELIEDGSKPWMRPVDLFIIDEAHNLRSENSTRYQKIEQLFQENPDSHVLMLTATPINNSLLDFANQIRLGSKGSLNSVSVPYVNTDGNIERRDFFDALKLIQSEVKKSEKDGTTYDWSKQKGALESGLRHYLVRTTRQGVEAEGGIIQKDGTARKFPKTIVNQIDYQYKESVLKLVHDNLTGGKDSIFEGINPCLLNIDVSSEITQQTSHPLDFIKAIVEDAGFLVTHFAFDEQSSSSMFLKNELNSIIPNVFQAISLLGFTPYRPDIYNRRYYKKSVQDMRDLNLSSEEKRRIQVQLVIHNILHVTWLKRLESSSASLLKSIEYYLKRLDLFKKYLDKGFIVTLADANTLETEYEEDIEQAFQDYDAYLVEAQAALESNENPSEIKKRGVERRDADYKVFDLESMRRDLNRDRSIALLLIKVLKELSQPENNAKLQRFVEFIEQTSTDQKYGSKILVFSFFSDTIAYLKENLPNCITKIPNFLERSGFVTGNAAGSTEKTARLFAPKAKKYSLKPEEMELDFLFATDVLSEGQNLQDAGILINYDLHWNPVRMIQRNGRINRLGSEFEEVLIANAKPHSDLEVYLKLVRRLERKIDTIKNSIGTDQSVLGETANPIEYIDYFSNDIATATAAAYAVEQIVEGESDILEFTDEYIFELRRFLATCSEDEILEFKNRIPLGKWNYLPESNNASVNDELFESNVTQDNCLALERVTGKTSITGAPINETMFVKIETIGRYRAEIIEDADALALIRATSDNNERKTDRIEVDRKTVSRRSEAIAKAKAESTESGYDLKPKQIEALGTISGYVSPEIDLQTITRNNIRNSKHKREFEQLVRQINRESKERGSIYSTTISKFEKLMNELLGVRDELREIDSIEGVLFYHSV